VGQWALYRAMRAAGVRVSISGMGADSLLGSDHDQLELALDLAASRLDFRRYWDLRKTIRSLNGSNFEIRRASLRGELRWLAKNCLVRTGLLNPLLSVRDRIRSVKMRLGYTSDESMPQFAGDLMMLPPAGQNRNNTNIEYPSIEGMSPLQAKYFRDFHVGTATYLASLDRLSMAHGVEVRVPYMDWRIVMLLLALPETSRNGGGYTKRVLREAMAGRMPDAVRLRTPKVAFMSPMDDWARCALKPWLLDLSASRAFNENAVWNGPAARGAVERAVNGKAPLWPVWPILQAYVLQQTFQAKARR
jgi:asparagine synthetase B (glutamine-hydrolysing)